MGVRGGLRVNAFRQLHLNIKSNLPSPFCSGAFAERDELCQCAPGEGKGADEAHRVAWEQAGMVQETDFRITCTFSEDAGQERGRPEKGNARVRASGGSSQGVELVRASERVVASVGAEISFSNFTQAAW